MKKNMPVVTRFAPSPTGYLHLGHLVNAIYVWGFARALGGRVLLRIEDHDRGRCRPEYEQAILDDLEWLGLSPDIGTIQEFREGATPYRQSDCSAHYEAILQSLAAQGLVYTCTCSRKEILGRSKSTGDEICYDGHCREAGYRPDCDGGVRVRLLPEEVRVHDARLGLLVQRPSEQCGDMLLRDRHGNWTYQFAVVADDTAQGVNLISRGEDLLASTGRQVQLARMLGRKDQALFLHHPLIADPDGKKLSKRDFAKGLRDYRAEGRSPQSVLGEAAWRVGLINAPDTWSTEHWSTLFAGDATIQWIRDAVDAQQG